MAGSLKPEEGMLINESYNTELRWQLARKPNALRSPSKCMPHGVLNWVPIASG